MPLKALVVEDIPAIREAIVYRVNEHPKLTVTDAFEDVDSATGFFLKGGRVDVVFLDISLFGGESGFEILRNLRRESETIPPVVLVTAEEEKGYAETVFREFREEVVDYIVKPLGKKWTDRQHECVRLIEARLEAIQSKVPKLTRLPVSKGSVTEYVPVEQITCLQKGEKGIEVHFAGDQRRFLDPYGVLGDYLSKLPQPHFVRVSRQAIVNARYVGSTKVNHKDRLALLTAGEVGQVKCTKEGMSSLREALAYG